MRIRRRVERRARACAAFCAGLALAGCVDETHCDKEPNYLGEAPMGTWERFPLTVHISLDGARTGEFAHVVRTVMARGLSRWSEHLGEVGSIVVVDEPAGADVRVIMGVPETKRFAGVTHIAGASYYARAWIEVDSAALRRGLERLRSGDLSRGEFSDIMDGIFAHEMGHVLGVVGHVPSRGHLMSEDPEWEVYPGPQVGDLNTIEHLYLCPRSERRLRRE